MKVIAPTEATEIIKAIDEGGQCTNIKRVIDALMKMSPQARQHLSYMLEGVYEYDPEQWYEWILETA